MCNFDFFKFLKSFIFNFICNLPNKSFLRALFYPSFFYGCNLINSTYSFLNKIIIYLAIVIAQKMKFPIKDFFSKYDEILSFLQIWSHLQKKSLMESYDFCVVRAMFEPTELYSFMWSSLNSRNFIVQ